MSRTSIFVAALTGSVVALALVAQASDFGDRTSSHSRSCCCRSSTSSGCVTDRAPHPGEPGERDRWVQGMNRIRNAYLELAPELEPYFVTSKYDDDAGRPRERGRRDAAEWPRYAGARRGPGCGRGDRLGRRRRDGGIAAIGLDLSIACGARCSAACAFARVASHGFVTWASGRSVRFAISSLDPLFPSSRIRRRRRRALGLTRGRSRTAARDPAPRSRSSAPRRSGR